MGCTCHERVSSAAESWVISLCLQPAWKYASPHSHGLLHGDLLTLWLLRAVRAETDRADAIMGPVVSFLRHFMVITQLDLSHHQTQDKPDLLDNIG